MKKLLSLLVASGLLICNDARAQTEKPEPSVNIQYFNRNGNFQYLKIKAMVKLDNKLRPVSDALLNVYLDDAIEQDLIAKVKTDENGEAKVVVPPILKPVWNRSYVHKFIATADSTKKYAATRSESDISILKIIVDTSTEGGARKVTAQVLARDSTNWKPVKGVELKLGVRRLGGDLRIGDEESYTTDSLGRATGEFKLEKLPAANRTNDIVLVAKTEENESYGNVSFEKAVPWGAYAKAENNFEKRSLWATRNKAPIWLIVMASSIMAAVWGVIIYLIWQIKKIKKLGKLADYMEEGTAKLNKTAVEQVV